MLNPAPTSLFCVHDLNRIMAVSALDWLILFLAILLFIRIVVDYIEYLQNTRGMK
jgi:hypothetical protein